MEHDKHCVGSGPAQIKHFGSQQALPSSSV